MHLIVAFYSISQQQPKNSNFANHTVSHIGLNFFLHSRIFDSDWNNTETLNELRHEIPNNVVCAHTSSLIRAFASHLNIKLLTKHHLEFLCLTGGFTGLSESTLVKAALLEI